MQRKIGRIMAVSLLVIFLWASLALAEYVGNSNSHKYHNPNCRWAQKISPKNKVVLSSADEATQKGKKAARRRLGL